MGFEDFGILPLCCGSLMAEEPIVDKWRIASVLDLLSAFGIYGKLVRLLKKERK